jgi:hypothetical protein
MSNQRRLQPYEECRERGGEKKKKKKKQGMEWKELQERQHQRSNEL